MFVRRYKPVESSDRSSAPGEFHAGKGTHRTQADYRHVECHGSVGKAELLQKLAHHSPLLHRTNSGGTKHFMCFVLEHAHPPAAFGDAVQAPARNPDHALVVGMNHISASYDYAADLDGFVDRAHPQRAVMDGFTARVDRE